MYVAYYFDWLTGSLVDYNDGYVGCIRGLRVNGILMDMASKLRGTEVYGVIEGKRAVGNTRNKNFRNFILLYIFKKGKSHSCYNNLLPQKKREVQIKETVCVLLCK